MELKPDDKLINHVHADQHIQTEQVNATSNDMPKDTQDVGQDAVKTANETEVTELDVAVSHEPQVKLSPTLTSNAMTPASQQTSLNTDSSVFSGSPMSLPSLSLSATQTPSNAQRPGERLRQARLLKNRGLKDIATDLNISERLLTAIEADDYKSLPEPAFIRGYLRSYGRLLGIDSDVLIVQFNELYTSATGLSSNHSLENSPLQQLAKLQTRSRKSNRWMWWLLIPVFLIVLFLVLRPVVKKMMGPSTHQTPTVQSAHTIESAQYTATNSALPQMTTTTLAPLPAVATTQNATDHLVLTLSKVSDVLVQDATGKTLVSGKQGTDKPLTLEGSSPFSITLNDAAAVSLSLNNEHIDLSPYIVDGHASFRLSR